MGVSTLPQQPGSRNPLQPTHSRCPRRGGGSRWRGAAAGRRARPPAPRLRWPLAGCWGACCSQSRVGGKGVRQGWGIDKCHARCPRVVQHSKGLTQRAPEEGAKQLQRCTARILQSQLSCHASRRAWLRPCCWLHGLPCRLLALLRLPAPLLQLLRLALLRRQQARQVGEQVQLFESCLGGGWGAAQQAQ